MTTEERLDILEKWGAGAAEDQGRAREEIRSLWDRVMALEAVSGNGVPTGDKCGCPTSGILAGLEARLTAAQDALCAAERKLYGERPQALEALAADLASRLLAKEYEDTPVEDWPRLRPTDTLIQRARALTKGEA